MEGSPLNHHLKRIIRFIFFQRTVCPRVFFHVIKMGRGSRSIKIEMGVRAQK